MSDSWDRYAFPHGHKDERRRLELLQQRLDPITIRRIEHLGLAPGVRCLEIGGGRGSITRWLCEHVGWAGDYDPVWAAHPAAQHEAFPSGSLSRGRAMLRQIHRLGLEDIGADGELDIVHPGTPLSEFYRLSMAATAPPLIDAGVLTSNEAAALIERVEEPDFLACGFVHMAAWGRRAAAGD